MFVKSTIELDILYYSINSIQKLNLNKSARSVHLQSLNDLFVLLLFFF